MKRILATSVLLGLSLLWAIGYSAEQRTWKAAVGGYEMQGEFVQLRNGTTVVLKKPDGTTIDVALDKLSDADRQYVAGITKPAANPFDQPAAPPASTVPANIASAKRTAAALERDAQACSTAKEALMLYKAFLDDADIPQTERDAAWQKFSAWQALAAADSRRVGNKWISPADIKKAKDEANDLIAKSLEFMRIKDTARAREFLERASKADTTSFEADFIMGLVYALAAKNVDKANYHFSECLRRSPNNVRILNNLALVEIKQGQFQAALNHIRTAINLSPQTPQLSQNIGRFIDQTSRRRLMTPPGTRDAAAKLYEQLLDAGGKPLNQELGWIYMLPTDLVVKTDDKSNPAKSSGIPQGVSDQVDDTSLINGGGTGFVVAPGYVLTNRHVVDGADGFLLAAEIDGKHNQVLPAEVAAVCEEADLALLKCDLLRAQPVSLNAALPRRGSDVMVLGFPEMFQLGSSLKSTRGAVVSMPDPATQNMLLYDAVTNPGNSGGPVCDASGNVVAVHSIGLNFGGKLAGGVPAAAAVAFVSKSIPGYAPAAAPTAVLAWPEVDARVSPSTVLIYRKETSMKSSDLGLGDGKLAFFIEDCSCSSCAGSQRVRCDIRGCVRGRVPAVSRQINGRNPVTGQAVFEDVIVRVTCGRCGGSGMIGCSNCTDGIDPTLRD